MIGRVGVRAVHVRHADLSAGEAKLGLLAQRVTVDVIVQQNTNFGRAGERRGRGRDESRCRRGTGRGRERGGSAEAEQEFSRLEGGAVETGKRLAGTITGGTGRYAGLEGEYSFTWRYVVAGEDGIIQGRAVGLTGRVRRGVGPQ